MTNWYNMFFFREKCNQTLGRILFLFHISTTSWEKEITMLQMIALQSQEENERQLIQWRQKIFLQLLDEKNRLKQKMK